MNQTTLVKLSLLLWGILPNQTEAATQQSQLKFSIMTYNLENLFDALHDPNKNDWTFQPLTNKQNWNHKKRCSKLTPFRQEECLRLDWTEAAIATKIQALAKTIQKGFPPHGPDILIVNEVENLTMLHHLRTSLGTTHYPHSFLIEGEDSRGIDTGILTRWNSITPAKLHSRHPSLPHFKLKRGVLQVFLQSPPNSPEILLNILGLHFPAPYQIQQKRQQGMELVEVLMREGQLSHPAVVTIAAGDFNVVSRESPVFFRKEANSRWQVSHLEGCHSCPGTYYYKKDQSWSFLDAILVARSTSKSQCQFVENSIKVIYDSESGASDHFPLVAEISCVIK